MLIAHLSDIHLCRENGGRRQRKLVVQLMKKAKSKGSEHFLLSGDIVEYANHNDLKWFFDDIQRAGISASQLSVLPGNHDIFPVSSVKLWRSLFRFGKHHRYHERFYHLARPYFGEVFSYRPLSYYRVIGEDHVLFAMDTNDHRVLNHRSSGRGYLAEERWDRVDQVIEQLGFKNFKKILMIHHYPFQWGHQIQMPQNSRMDVDFLDLEQVQEQIRRRDWHFVACGHSHVNRGVRSLGNVTVINSSSRPSKNHYVCSIIDTEAELVPKRLETNLDGRLRSIFSRHQGD